MCAEARGGGVGHDEGADEIIYVLRTLRYSGQQRQLPSMSSNAAPMPRSSSTWGGEEMKLRTMSSVFWSIPLSLQFLTMHFANATCWPRWSCAKASWKLGSGPLRGATTRLRRSTSPTHSGGLTILHNLSMLSTRTSLVKEVKSNGLIFRYCLVQKQP